jgi:hypothetical protein
LLGLLESKVIELARKSESTWSRGEVTIVFDDSIFKQWLKNEKTGTFYDRYFSGQMKSTVYGFRLSLCGISIADTFYPSHFKISQKSDCTKEVSNKLLDELHEFLWKISQKENVSYPNLFVSADNGFDSELLLDKCTELSKKMPIVPICVPKKTNLLEIDGVSSSVSKVIEDRFIRQEAEYLRTYEGKGVPIPPFTLRVNAIYSKYKKKFVFLFFRLNGSKKVSVIYTTDLNIKSKTLRRRWFQRTLIEQFFRLLKDTLKIQQSKNVDKNGFERKICIFIFKAIHCHSFRNYCRKKFRLLKGWAFTRIRQRITFDGIEKELLASLVFDENTFCME